MFIKFHTLLSVVKSAMQIHQYIHTKHALSSTNDIKIHSEKRLIGTVTV
jgi:hypothetical protein